MNVGSSSYRRISLLSVIALLAFAPAGCKSTQSASSPAASPVAAAPAASTRPLVTPPPTVNKHLYSAEANPQADINAAVKQASLEHKRVILAFGGDWCGDCQVLEIYLHQSPNLELLDKNFLLVHVDIGHYDKNLDITEKYKVPLKKGGVPALAVLDGKGNLVYAQQIAEFGDMRYMYPSSVTDFLNRWKA